MKKTILLWMLANLVLSTWVLAMYVPTTQDTAMIQWLEPIVSQIAINNPWKLSDISAKIEVILSSYNSWTRIWYVLWELHTLIQNTLQNVQLSETQMQSNGSAISIAEFDSLSKKQWVTVIDLRTEEELLETWVLSEIDLNINFYDEKQMKQLEALDKWETYLLYCRSDNRSWRAVDTLVELWFTNVYDLDWGITQWINEGNEVQDWNSGNHN